MHFNDEDPHGLATDQAELLAVVMARLARQDQRIADLEQQVAEQTARLDAYLGTLATVTSFLSEAVGRLRPAGE